MSSALNYGIGFIIILTTGILYERWREKDDLQKQITDYDFIKQYLLTESTLAKAEKPILWIPLQFEYNARNWESFGSRGTTCMNKPYISLCVRSIIERCGNDFQVCLVDDASFNKILPGWSIRIQSLPDPLKEHMRYLAMAKLLHAYGGMVIPPSFVCLRSLYSVYSIGVSNMKMFSGELVSTSNTSAITTFFPSMKIMGCEKESDVMGNFINYLEHAISGDYTNEMEFNGGPEKWIYEKAMSNQVLIMNSNIFGVKDSSGNAVPIETLIGDVDIRFDKKMCGIYINEDMLGKRTSLNWFERLSHKQVLESDTLIGKYLLASNSSRL
jgi:hypothetical protein